MIQSPNSTVADILSRRDARWVQRRCARRGHILAHLSDAGVSALTGPIPGPPADARALLCCLRCGNWIDPEGVLVSELLGTPDSPVELSELPLPARGAHGRRFGLLRLLAVERAARGSLMLLGAIVIFQVASQRGSILSQIERLLQAYRPLGQELGVQLTGSWVVTEIEKYLGGNGNAFRLAGLGLLAYGIVQIVEGVGLWGGWRWAEYLATIATSLFIPLEIYELMHKPTALKAAALVINVIVVIYLVYKGRLFGVRGGHVQFLAELRDSTLLADMLRSLSRPSTELSGTRVV
jgi:uncharacterized membrane protein (DUF2068 family)